MTFITAGATFYTSLLGGGVDSGEAAGGGEQIEEADEGAAASC